MTLSKNSLKEQCIAVIQARIDGLATSIAGAQAAANEETKSSAGDKYETARAMNQLEKDMLTRQLAENRRELSAMMEIDCTGEHAEVKLGSLITCKEVSFFVLGGLGKMMVEDQTLFVISPNAPLARSFMGKVKGDLVKFNGKEIEILDVH